MATDAAPSPASSDSIIQTRLFGFLVRTALALLAFWALWFAQGRYISFRQGESPFLGYDNSPWHLSLLATIVAGLLFGLAAWPPFTRIRYLRSRLLLAAVALVPVAHFSWIILNHHVDPASWLWRAYWFDFSFEMQLVLAGFAGVALAAGFRAKDPVVEMQGDPSDDLAPAA
jgi:hypothetical protein